MTADDEYNYLDDVLGDCIRFYPGLWSFVNMPTPHNSSGHAVDRNTHLPLLTAPVRSQDGEEPHPLVRQWRILKLLTYSPQGFTVKELTALSGMSEKTVRRDLVFLRRAVTDPERCESILAGAEMTAKEKEAYRLELARKEHGYKTGEERLESNDDCKWVDVSYVKDSQGRRIYFMEMGDAIVGEEDEEDDDDAFLDMVIDRMDEIWHWKQQPLELFGPFRSVEEAEEWMAQKGAFEEVD